jgi:hypothetical protein
MASGSHESEAMHRPLAIPLGELRRRYDALGPIEELPGERTIRTRCFTFESMLERGPICAELLREQIGRLKEMERDPEDAMRDHPELCSLVLEAWPQA